MRTCLRHNIDMKNNLLRIPVDLLSFQFTVRTETRFLPALQAMGIKFVDEITPENLPKIRAAFSSAEGVGKKSLDEFDRDTADLPNFLKKVENYYWGRDGWNGVFRVDQKIEILLDGNMPVPQEDVRELLIAYRKLREK